MEKIQEDIKHIIGIEDKNEINTDKIDETCFDVCGINYTDRIIIFFVFFGIGWLLSFIAFVSFTNPNLFAIYYTIGNIFNIISGFFVFGVCKHFKSLFATKRIVATIIYLFFIGLTLYLTIKQYNIFLVLLCVCIQFMSMIWFYASYFPYGREILTKLFSCCKF